MDVNDRNRQEHPEAASTEQELKRARFSGWRDVIACLVIICIFLLAKDFLAERFGFTFGDSYDGLKPVLEETQFGITGLDGVTHTFVYTESDISLHDGLKAYLKNDKGELVEGQETKKVCSGVYRRADLGEYQLHVQTRLDKYILVRNSDGVLIFNLESNDTTRELYEYFLELRDRQLDGKTD